MQKRLLLPTFLCLSILVAFGLASISAAYPTLASDPFGAALFRTPSIETTIPEEPEPNADRRPNLPDPSPPTNSPNFSDSTSSVPSIVPLPETSLPPAPIETTTSTTVSAPVETTVPELPEPAVPTLPEITVPEVTIPDPLDSEVVNKTNAERTTELQWSGDLAAYAKRHLAVVMATGPTGSLFHSDISVLLNRWSVVGENLGTGLTLDSIHLAYMGSPTHRENVVFEGYTHIGSATEQNPITGMYWTVQIYGAR